MLDLTPREKAVFAPLLLLVLWMGVYPSSFLTPIRASVENIVQRATAAQKSAASNDVIPAEAGIHASAARAPDEWVPAFAGMTVK
jgi:NADH-quinone oxidoreductase subunit M